MRLPILLTLLCSAGVAQQAMAEACVIRSHDDRVAVTLCQANGNIPTELFRSGFCQPELKGQQVEVEFVEQCPDGAFGICRDAQVSNMPYRQDIHYYGVASDARFLQPACEQNSQGRWQAE
ncbi:NADH:ubiquinone oxidoreductase [Stutzerimonas stutzeri]|uniref:NADH:ubiquinone oxidoreductase n=1 Tax=Stutzerimonas stutzeri TaxID=316 RepID=UPI000F791546|nr:NADH:ubiquinone oxidoreductase [Stutzerimonas stutzeri]MDH0497762.1 NADH:ubiquinone oxidoreductase [Stutzerimonas stutzeri]RRW07713.1 NADH:ubiquinone oxidoreductase [Stutzerimonas stutzeri]WGG16718.1 NADH:ubiquinone oxidoreductase [Stutzerimonas stutzeri]